MNMESKEKLRDAVKVIGHELNNELDRISADKPKNVLDDFTLFEEDHSHKSTRQYIENARDLHIKDAKRLFDTFFIEAQKWLLADKLIIQYELLKNFSVNTTDGDFDNKCKLLNELFKECNETFEKYINIENDFHQNRL